MEGIVAPGQLSTGRAEGDQNNESGVESAKGHSMRITRGHFQNVHVMQMGRKVQELED